LSHDATMVTVVCITYNHEKYIEEALKSFLGQKTSFKYKIFVGDDHSSDRTGEIVKAYSLRYPDRIVPFIRGENMGAQHNLIDLCKKAESPYIAFCEGDDYWTDPYKLQKQYDRMESDRSLSACFHNTEILVETRDREWFLANRFKPDAKGRFLWPFGMKGFNRGKTRFTARDYIALGFVHTSSMFFRWNYDLAIPDWYYTHMIGDYTLMMLQVGRGEIAFLPDVMSAYRRHENGAYYFEDMQAYYRYTREDWIRIMINLRNYFGEKYNGSYYSDFQKRLEREVMTFLQVLTDNGEYDEFKRVLETYGREVFNALSHYMQEHKRLRGYSRVIPPENLDFLNNHGKEAKKINKKIEKHSKSKKLKTALRYWLYGFVPKDKNLWVFSSFKKRGYLDNCKYLYEYINENHPEIRAVWLTKDGNVKKELRKKGLPVYDMNSREGKNALVKASLAFTDRYKMSDYSNSAINSGTKVVQLWHGVGMKNLDNFTQTTIKGVRYSDDIVAKKNDGLAKRLKKSVNYLRRAPFRELSEEYFLMLATAPESLEAFSKSFHTPRERFFICGYPRTAPLFKNPEAADSGKPCFLYAPTFRWQPEKEVEMVDLLLAAIPDIQAFMEKVDGTFVIRLHPHTWRNYRSKIELAIQDASRVLLDSEKDVYGTLGKYTMMISDYSSIVYDYLLLNRPVVFFCYDYEFFTANECNLKYDYDEYSPGPKARTWSEVLASLGEYLEQPEKDREWRTRILDFFYEKGANGPDSSERLVAELKNRLKIR
jgi:CDP-glycerol glycerophosphotransferase (TagB/SpsB family)